VLDVLELLLVVCPTVLLVDEDDEVVWPMVEDVELELLVV
jgi:hypothetical protein